MRLATPLLCALALLFAATADAQTTCTNTIVTNGTFTDGLVTGSMPAGAVTGWSQLTNTPQVTTAGCDAPGAVQMWGNLVVGESIKQQLPGVGIEAGKTYNITVCYRWLENPASPNLPPYVRFRLTASSAMPAAYPPLGGFDLIGTTPNTSSTTWLTHTFTNWVAPNNASWITINPENDETLNDGNYVSWGQIDDVCIELVEPVPTEDASWSVLKSRYVQ